MSAATAEGLDDPEARGQADLPAAAGARAQDQGAAGRRQCAAAACRPKPPRSSSRRFTDVGLIDDAAFARAWVESRHHSRGLSKRSLSAELGRHGVPERRDPRGGRRARPRAGGRDRQATGRAEAGRLPRSATGDPRQAGGGHAGQEGLPARPGLPADQGGHAAGRRRAGRDGRRPDTSTPTPGTRSWPATTCNHRMRSRRSRRALPLTSATPPRTAASDIVSPLVIPAGSRYRTISPASTRSASPASTRSAMAQVTLLDKKVINP